MRKTAGNWGSVDHWKTTGVVWCDEENYRETSGGEKSPKSCRTICYRCKEWKITSNGEFRVGFRFWFVDSSRRVSNVLRRYSTCPNVAVARARVKVQPSIKSTSERLAPSKTSRTYRFVLDILIFLDLFRILISYVFYDFDSRRKSIAKPTVAVKKLKAKPAPIKTEPSRTKHTGGKLKKKKLHIFV